MPVDTSRYPEILRLALETAAPGWAETHEQGDQMGDAEKPVLEAIEAEIARRRPELDEEAAGRETNRLTTFLRGYGEDFLWFNEHLPEDRPIGTYPTLGAFDREEHAFQEKALADSCVEHGSAPPEPTPYRGRLSDWIRFVENDDLVYGNLSTVAHHVYDEIEDAFQKVVEEAVPHKLDMDSDPAEEGDLEDVEESERPSFRRVRITTTTNPPGREDLVLQLKQSMWKREREIWNDLHERFSSEETPKVWIFPNEWDADMRNFVFSGPKAVEAVRPGSFSKDCAALARPKEELDAIVASVVPGLVEAFAAEIAAAVAADDAGGTAPEAGV